MARLIYSAIMSLDGYTADADGRIEWAAPDDEVHAFVNERAQVRQRHRLPPLPPGVGPCHT